MATVTDTATGLVYYNVFGPLLDYYVGEGARYTIDSTAPIQPSSPLLTRAVADGIYVPRQAFAAATTAATSTLAPGTFEQVDASGGSKTRKLAAGAVAGDQVTVKVTAIGGTNTVTVQGDTGVTAPSIPLVALNQSVTLVWTGSAWVVSGRDNPKVYFDNGYFHPVSTDGTNGLPAPTGVGPEMVITAAGLDDIRYNGVSL